MSFDFLSSSSGVSYSWSPPNPSESPTDNINNTSEMAQSQQTTRDVEIIFGAGWLASHTPEEQAQFLNKLTETGVTHIDTAFIYSGSERVLGNHSASSRFTIDTKAPGFRPGCLSKESVTNACKKSLERLKSDQVNVYFLHSPDKNTPLEETLEAVQRMYEAGAFKYFGLSNFLPSDVSLIHSIQLVKGHVLPTVYQGLYNPLARSSETTLFPLLRKLNMKFYAYSPLAAGLLTKTPQDIENATGSGGRWDVKTPLGKMLHGNYNNGTMKQGMQMWDDISKKYHIGKAEMAYRWVKYHSILDGKYGDGIIFGASSVKQVEETVGWLRKGKLDDGVVNGIEEVWRVVEGVSPVNNYYGRKKEKPESKI